MSIVTSLKNVRLGDVIDIRDGTHDTPRYVTQGVPLLTGKNLSDSGLCFDDINFISQSDHEEISKRSAVSEGDILYGMIGTIGKPTIVETQREFSIKNIALFKQSNPQIHNRFLLWLLDSADIRRQIGYASKGGTQKFVSLGSLRGITTTFPVISEQYRIAAILDQADTLRAKRREALAQLDSLTQSIFMEMFGDPATNPMSWAVHTIEEICKVKGGKRLPKGSDYSAVPTPFRYVRVIDMKGGKVDESNLHHLTPEVQRKIARYIVNTGDVIISIAGSIGVVAAVPKSLNGANLTENAAKLVARTQADYIPDFLASMLRMKAIQSQIESHVGQVTIGKLALYRIEKLLIPLPPLHLQQTFANSIQTVESLKATHRAALTELNTLFASLQHRAFQGEL